LLDEIVLGNRVAGEGDEGCITDGQSKLGIAFASHAADGFLADVTRLSHLAALEIALWRVPLPGMSHS
jgi:hypothetical protein